MYPPDFLPVLLIVVWSALTLWAWGGNIRAKVRQLHLYDDDRSQRELRASLASAFVAAAAIASVVGFLGTGSTMFLALPLGAVGTSALMARA